MAYIVFDKLWDIAIEGFLLLQYKLFSSHALKSSGSCLFTVLCVEFSLFYQKSHPSCKWAGLFLRKNTVLLAARVHAPQHAPVTVNDARPSWFFGWTLLFAGARVWFPVVAQINPGMLGKTHRSGSRAERGFVPANVRRNTLVVEAGKDLKCLGVKRWTLPPARLDITLQKRTSLQNNNGTRILHESLKTN